jgi:hypothetical protein
MNSNNAAARIEPTSKRIDVEGQRRVKYEAANEDINSHVHVLSQVLHLAAGETIVQTIF